MRSEEIERLSDGWGDIVNQMEEGFLDEKHIKPLIYDTYHFFKKELADGETIKRDQLEIYKYISQACFWCKTDLGAPDKFSLQGTCEDFLEGLIYVIEYSFDAGYGANPLPIGFNRTPDGCADIEADMTSYETFEKDFNEDMEYFKELLGEDIDE